jgi:hypothetical protein
VCENKLKRVPDVVVASSANYNVRRRGEILICIIDASVNKNDQIAPHEKHVAWQFVWHLKRLGRMCNNTNMRRDRGGHYYYYLVVQSRLGNGSRLLL